MGAAEAGHREAGMTDFKSHDNGFASEAPAAGRWVGTWAASPHGPFDGHALMLMLKTKFKFSGQTVRQIVHASIGGSQVRVRLSNAFGKQPMNVGAARIALRSLGVQIIPGSDCALTFNGQSSVTIPPGGLVVSDPAGLSIPPRKDLAVSFYFPGDPGTT